MTNTANIPAEATTYYHAAIQDEINGFELTAAMEWQKAAELLVHFPFVANVCWQQWERLTQLPRSFATPISTPPEAAAA